jgi:hypothetical protein
LTPAPQKIFLQTPLTGNPTPNWDKFFQYFSSFPARRRTVATGLGITEALLVKLKLGRRVGCDKDLEDVAARFYAALILTELVQEEPVGGVEIEACAGGAAPRRARGAGAAVGGVLIET